MDGVGGEVRGPRQGGLPEHHTCIYKTVSRSGRWRWRLRLMADCPTPLGVCSAHFSWAGSGSFRVPMVGGDVLAVARVQVGDDSQQ